MMPSLSRTSVAVGDTLVLRWDLPAGAKLLQGVRPGDSLAVQATVPGTWILQPLSPGNHGGDTLKAVSGRDTLTEFVPRFEARSRLQSAQDTVPAGFLAPEEVAVPFPWKEAGIGLALVVLTALAVRWWMKRPKKAVPVVVPAAAPPDPVVVAESALDALAERAAKGLSSRETAFDAGEIVRALHRSLFGFALASESTSREWRDWSRQTLGPEGDGALGQFLSEADRLRYAGAEADPARLFLAARGCVRAAAKERKP